MSLFNSETFFNSRENEDKIFEDIKATKYKRVEITNKELYKELNNIYFLQTLVNLSVYDQNDPNFITSICELNGNCIVYASEKLKQDKNIQLVAIDNIPSSIRHFALYADENIWLYALNLDPAVYIYAPDNIKKCQIFIELFKL